MTFIFICYSAYVWTAGTVAPQSAPATSQVRHGQILFQQNNCTACHQIYGLGGYMGPDLTNVISQKGSSYARAFLMSGTTRMPNYEFDEQELDDLISFLSFVDTIGSYASPGHKGRWNGTVAQLNE